MCSIHSHLANFMHTNNVPDVTALPHFQGRTGRFGGLDLDPEPLVCHPCPNRNTEFENKPEQVVPESSSYAAVSCQFGLVTSLRVCACVCARACVGGADKSSALTNKEVTQSLEGLKAAEAHTFMCVCSVGVFSVYHCVCGEWEDFV